MLSAYIVPHPPIARPEVGRGEEREIRATLDAFREVSKRIAADAPETIVLISPHSIFYEDAFYMAAGTYGHGDLVQFRAPFPDITCNYDTELADEILRLSNEQDVPVIYSEDTARMMDHGAVVPLLFLEEVFTGYKLLRISPSYLSNDMLMNMGRIIARACLNLGKRVTIIASGDLSHKLLESGPYGFTPEGPEFDRLVTDVMKSGRLKDFAKLDRRHAERAAQCGLYGFVMLAGALENFDVIPDFLSYEGPFGVGYAICAFRCEDICIRLAREALTYYVNNGTLLPCPEDLPAWMYERKAGVFVSLKKQGDLRGCIGTISPWTDCVATEIIALAAEAGTMDPRFPPVRVWELAELVYDVDILCEPEPSTYEELDPSRYGVIVTSGIRKGLLLPALEGVDTVEAQVRIACQKAGIGRNEAYSIQRFTVERHV